MTTKKLTNVLAIEMVLTFEETKRNSELVEKLHKILEQFEKKSGTSKKAKTLTKGQKENMEIKQTILNVLSNEPKTIKELQEEHSELIGTSIYSNQKISALLRQLVAEGSVERTEQKRKAYFSLVGTKMLVAPVEAVVLEMKDFEGIDEIEEEVAPVEEVEEVIDIEEVEEVEDDEPTPEELEELEKLFEEE